MSQEQEREALNDDAIWEIAKQKCGLLFSDVLHMNKAQMAATVRAALASQQAAGGPVGLVVPIDGHAENTSKNRMATMFVDLPVGTHLYASPPSREPLTDEQIRKWWGSENGLEDMDMCNAADFRKVVRAVEARLGIHSREGGSNG